MLRSIVPAICLLLFSGPLIAGAWDVGPFDNDDALDWVWELTESNDLSAVSRALNGVIRSPGYIEAPTASTALAAAEVVAAVAGRPRDGLPEEVVDWVRHHDLNADKALAAKAVKAIKLIMDDESSELAQLWADSPTLADAWRSDLQGLIERLQ